MLPNIKTICKKYLPVLHSNQEMLGIFPEKTINVIYKRNKNLKGPISPSLFPKAIKGNSCLIKNCSRRCGICKKCRPNNTKEETLITAAERRRWNISLVKKNDRERGS